jgi:hypothetical protein
MSGDFAAAQSPGPTARKRYFPNSKAATGFMARNKLRPSATALANPRGDPFGAASSYSNPKNTGNPGDSRAQTVIERQVSHLRRHSCSERVA